MDIADLRAWLQKMIAAMRFADLLTAVIGLIVRMRDANTELRKQVANLRRKRPHSETLARVGKQFVFAFMVAEVAGAQSAAKPPKPDGRKGKTKRSRVGKHPGRAPLPGHLERIQVLNPVPPELRICPACGSEMTTVGHSICEILDVIPARLVVQQRLDERVACPHDDTIVSAPTPPQLVERGKLGTNLVVDALADKYVEHLPIERQCLRYRRAGVDVAPQTLGRTVAASIDLLMPLAKLIYKRTRGPGLLATDATGIPVLDTNAPDGIRNGTMWFWRNRRWVSFVYSAKGDSKSVRDFLGEDIRRIVQCDGSNVTRFIERACGKCPGCWAHGRRRLAEAARSGDALSMEGLGLISRLLMVERASAIADDSLDQLLARRAQDSTPIVAEIRAWIDAHRGVIPPRTPMGQALGYLHRQWPRLTLFLEDPRIALTNNEIERELRKLVLGRNYVQSADMWRSSAAFSCVRADTGRRCEDRLIRFT